MISSFVSDCPTKNYITPYTYECLDILEKSHTVKPILLLRKQKLFLKQSDTLSHTPARVQHQWYSNIHGFSTRTVPA